MGNLITPTGRVKKPVVKKSEVVQLKNEGYSVAAIAVKLGISRNSVYYHLMPRKKYEHKPKLDAIMPQPEVMSPVVNQMFEFHLFGTLIRTDKKPAVIERVGNRIVIN